MIKKILKNLFIFLGIWLLFIFNIWLINQGSGFTVPRELLFRTQAEILKPIFAFPIVLATLFSINKYLSPLLKKIKKQKLLPLIFLFCLVSAFSLSWTVQTNPDYAVYFTESEYLVKNGLVEFFKNWGKFNPTYTVPLMPFLYGNSFRILNNKPLATIVVNLALFLGLLIVTYLTARKIFNKKIAFFTIILLATTPFVLTQAHLLLVDLGMAFFLNLSLYLILKLIEKPSRKKSLLFGGVLFIAFLTKVTAILCLAALFLSILLWIIFNKKKKEVIWSFALCWLTAGLLGLLYVFWQKEVYWKILFSPRSKQIIHVSLPLIIVWLGLILVNFLFSMKERWQKIKNKQQGKILLAAITIFYFFLGILLLQGNKNSFYLRTIFIGINLPMALLFYFSFYFGYKKKNLIPFVSIPWLIVVNFIPFTMFKHQLYSYPIIIMLAIFSLTTIWKKTKNQINMLLIILAFSFSITYFFFLPMINLHTKNNIRDAVRFANQYQPQQISILFFPVGKQGEKFQKSLEKTITNPYSPSLTSIINFYSKSEVNYEKTDDFIKKIKEGLYPDIVFLVYHFDLPETENDELKAELDKYYIEGPMFNKAKGAGIWRVKIKFYHYTKQ